MGLTWAAGYGVLGLIYSVLNPKPPRGVWESILHAIPGNASIGFIFGSVFAVILSVAERHRRLEDLSLARVALWGALGPVLIIGTMQLVFWGNFQWDQMLKMALNTGGFSAGTVALARRGESRLLEGE